MNSFRKVAFTSYPVTDLARSRKFYEEVIGLPAGEFGNAGYQEYDLGGTTFALDSAPLPFLIPGTQASLTLEVSDIRSLVEMLKSRGVEFLPLDTEIVMETSVCHVAFFRDPDGNTVGLHQLKD